jgi:hypothetical protein
MNFAAMGAGAAKMAAKLPVSEVRRIFLHVYLKQHKTCQEALTDAEAYVSWAKGLKSADSLGEGTFSELQAMLLRGLHKTGADLLFDTPGGSTKAYVEYVHRYNLSSRVWNAVEKAQEDIWTVIRGGEALGRDKKDIAADLEQFLKKDGGARVKGRWGKLAPDRKLEDRTEKIMADKGLNPLRACSKSPNKNSD